MKHGFLVAVGSAALVIAGLSGCSSDDSSSASETSSETSAAVETTSAAETTTEATATAEAGAGAPKVTIDGQDQAVQGTVVCSAMGGNMNIAIGEAATGIAVVVSEGDTPTVSSVGLGNVNGVTLGYQSGAGQGEATAEKDGNTYKVTGTATGVDMADPMTPVTKPFEIEVSCP